jgi:hypothetical protein
MSRQTPNQQHQELETTGAPQASDSPFIFEFEFSVGLTLAYLAIHGMVGMHTQLPLRFSPWSFSSFFNLSPYPDIQANRQLVLDLLSVHLIRHVDGNTIISCHPEIDRQTTSAKYLHERILFAGQ